MFKLFKETYVPYPLWRIWGMSRSSPLYRNYRPIDILVFVMLIIKEEAKKY